MFKLIASSADPHKVALTVKGFFSLIAPLAIWYFGITDLEWSGFVDSVVTLITLLMTAASICFTIWGLVRKWYLGRWSHPAA